MKKIILLILLTFIFLIGQTYSLKNNDEEKIYMLKPSNITSKNIELLNECINKIITIYPENNYNIMNSYIFNYKTLKQNKTEFEKIYLNKLNKISTTEYYKLKLKGIKINYIKVYSTTTKIKKCNNYLEKVESL